MPKYVIHFHLVTISRKVNLINMQQSYELHFHENKVQNSYRPLWRKILDPTLKLGTVNLIGVQKFIAF